MSADANIVHEGHEAVHRHEPPKGFIRKYVFSLDHKVIGVQYLTLALVAVFVGMILSVLMRFSLTWPDMDWPLIGQIKPDSYLSLLTIHGTMMVFFVLTTAPQGGFGNYFLPIQIGAEDMAFPVLNMLSFWVTFVGFIVLVFSFFVPEGAPIGGWTAYPPLSAIPRAGRGHESLDSEYPYLLPRLTAGSAQFHHDAFEHARQGNVPDAYAAHLLGLVYDGCAGAPCVSGAARGWRAAVSGQKRGDELLYSGGVVYQRRGAAACRRLADSLATSLLVLRPPGSLYRHPSRHGRNFARPCDLRPQARLRLSRDGFCHLRYWSIGILRLGTPHVHQRHESLFGDGVLGADAFHRRALGGQNLQLARPSLGWEDSFYDAEALFHRLA